nr:MAG TPA: ISL3 zinc-finger of transposase IS204/IS1001/IS1096/IS1165 [Siphoviridae sp. ctBfm1]
MFSMQRELNELISFHPLYIWLHIRRYICNSLLFQQVFTPL